MLCPQTNLLFSIFLRELAQLVERVGEAWTLATRTAEVRSSPLGTLRKRVSYSPSLSDFMLD